MTQEQRLALLAQALGADIKALTNALADQTKIVQLTQAEYTALSPKDPNTLYVVIG